MEFFDQFEHTIDDKGRLVLPAAYREGFVGGGFLVLLANTAALFTRDGWEKYRRKLELSGSLTRRDLQHLFASASPFVPDSQHRIAINQRVRGRAGLEGREVTVAGFGSHAAIYSRTAWAEREAIADGPDADGRTLAQKIDDLDFV